MLPRQPMTALLNAGEFRTRITVDLTADQSGVDLFTEAGSPSASPLTIIVNVTGAKIDGRLNDAAIYADFPAGTEFEFNISPGDEITGEGGDAGQGGPSGAEEAGGGGFLTFAGVGLDGQDGASAIRFVNSATVTVTNSGSISGGGGGGPGGGGVADATSGDAATGGGGGGGAGSPVGAAGAAGANVVGATLGEPGVAGTATTGGAGGAGNPDGIVTAGAGGAGGALGVAGSAGGSGAGGSDSEAAGTPGAAGKAFRLDGGGSVTFTVRGTINGDVDNEV
jgi:hypothetical protein